MEKEFVALEQVRDDVLTKLKAAQNVTEKSQQEIKELQDRLSRALAELDRAKTTLEQHATERKRLDAEWQERINTAKTIATQQAVEKAGAEIRELQERLTQARAEVKRTKTAMEEQLGQLTRLEADNRALAETKRTLSLGMTRMRETQISREAEFAERQKRLVDALRDGAVLLQARLQEASNGGSARYEMPPVPTEPPPAPKLSPTKA
jgi:chromosome segregation ATPase